MKGIIADKYDKCTRKQKIAIITALCAFVLGWGLTIAGFIIPPIGEIADSVLWVLGQALVYAASVFGITGYFSSETMKMKQDVNDYFDNKMRIEIEECRIAKENEDSMSEDKEG